MAKNTGARGLRAILESILTEAMYEVFEGLKFGMNLEQAYDFGIDVSFLNQKLHGLMLLCFRFQMQSLDKIG